MSAARAISPATHPANVRGATPYFLCLRRDSRCCIVAIARANNPIMIIIDAKVRAPIICELGKSLASS